MTEEVKNVVNISKYKRAQGLKKECKVIEEGLLAIDRSVKILLKHYSLRPINNLLNEIHSTKTRLEERLVFFKKELSDYESEKN